MNKRHTNWYLLIAFLLWGLSASLVLFQHQAVQLQSSSLRVFADEFDDFKRSLVASKNSRMDQLAELERGVVRVSSALQVLKGNNETGLISSDLTQLEYLTERFRNRAGDYLALQLNRRGLSVQVEQETLHQETSEVLPLYHELGSFLFSTFHANKHAGDVDYLVLESLLLRSKSLPSPHKQKLQNLLSLTSTVLAEQAQIKSLTADLIDNAIKKEVRKIDSQYVQLENSLLYISLACALVSLLMVLSSVLVGRKEKDDAINDEMTMKASEREAVSEAEFATRESQHHQTEGESLVGEPLKDGHNTGPLEPTGQSDDTKVSENVELALRDISEPVPVTPQISAGNKIDIDYMLDTFEQDTESVVMVLEVFLADHQNDAEKISQHFEQDRALAQRTAHSLKGVAGNLGAADLKSTALALEKTLEECPELPVDLLAQLNNDLSLVVKEVMAYLETAK